MSENPPTSNDRTRTYPVASDITLAVTPDAGTGEVTVRILHDNEELYRESVTATTLCGSEWWSDNHPERIVNRIENETPEGTSDEIVTGMTSAFFEAAIDLRGEGSGPPEVTVNGYEIVESPPPKREPENIDIEQRWEELEGSRYRAFTERDQLTAWGDEAGTGKTTSGAKGASALDRKHVVFGPTHEWAWEFQSDEEKPDGYLHLKGPKQPDSEDCMRAKVKDESCETHPDEECPTMCPVYTLSEDDPKRQAYEKLVKEVGPGEAHRILDLHDGEKCAWNKQWDTLDNGTRVVTVHSYLTHSPLQEFEDIIVDDLQGLLSSTRSFEKYKLETVVEVLDSLTTESATVLSSQFQELSGFVNEIVETLDNAELISDNEVEYKQTLADLEPPQLSTPSWVQDRVADDDDELAETLAWMKHAYNETLVNRIEGDIWEGTPFCFNALLAASVEAGLSSESGRRAIAVPPSVNVCPDCGESTVFNPRPSDLSVSGSGSHRCKECGWNEQNGGITDSNQPVARAIAWLGESDRDGNRPVAPALRYRELPHPDDLPSPANTLILDATPTPEVYASLFGIDVDDIVVEGNEPVELNGMVSQVISGQYHRSTIANENSKALRDMIQHIIDRRCERFDDVIVVGHSRNRGLYDLPDEAEWMYFHATRGLDRPDADAIIVIGAPHPNIDDLRRDARLLAIGRDDIRIGGQEYNTRPNDNELEEPIYRKYYYSDDNGVGRAAPTKAYSGLVGDLFYDRREQELVQVAHRVRPVLPGYPQYIDLITSVPTDLSVDTLTTRSEWSEALSEQLPITNNAIRFLEHLCEALDGDVPRGFKKDELVNQRDDGMIANTRPDFHTLAEAYGENVRKRTIDNWVAEIADIGLLIETDDYPQRKGVVFTANPATLKKALLVLTNNTHFEVGTVRRLKTKIKESGGTLEWLEWADEVFGLPAETIDGYDP